VDRRDLFSSIGQSFQGEKLLEVGTIRPPYFKDLLDFNKCIECEDKWCIGACEEDILDADKDGIPLISFANSGCTYCDDCAIDCDQGVLEVEHKQNIKANIKIDMIKCMSWHDTLCFSCKDPCLDNAIEFIGMFRPEINLSQCTLCGFCIKYCPVDAISITELKEVKNYETI